MPLCVGRMSGPFVCRYVWEGWADLLYAVMCGKDEWTFCMPLCVGRMSGPFVCHYVWEG